MEWFGVELTFGNVSVTILILVIVSVLYDWLTVLAWRRKFGLVGPLPLPFFGNFLGVFFNKSLEEIEAERLKKYGPVTTSITGAVRGIHIADINILKKMFIKEHAHFQNRFTIDGFDPHPIDLSVLSLRDAHWKRVRNIITPTFSSGKIKLMTDEMNYCAHLLTTGLVDKAKAGESVDSHKHFGCYSMDVIAGTAFGIRTDAYNNPDQPFVQLAQKVFGKNVLKNPLVILAFFFPNFARILTQYFGVSFFYPLDSLKFFIDLIRKLIEDRNENGGNERADLLQHMINAGADVAGDNATAKKLSTNELLAQGFLIFIAGYETTSLLLTFLSYVLTTHPDIQDKLIAEIDAAVEIDALDVSYDTIQEMSYLDQVINETLRMYPPLVRMNRMTSVNQDVQVDGYWFPRNTFIGFSIWQIHHEMGFYPEPKVFKPERFSAAEKAKRDPITFMPFGHGPRNCIGMRMALFETKVAVVQLLRKVKFVRCPETEENLELASDTFLRTKRPIQVGLELR